MNTTPLTTTDPRAALSDLEPLHDIIGDAEIVGLGESTHGAHEIFTLKHRVLRYLVEELGFRSLAFEDDWSIGVEVNDYIRYGKGDPDEINGRMAHTWRTEEIRDLIVWLHDYNQGRADKVSFLGADVTAARANAYDLVMDHVRQSAPERLASVQTHYDHLRPDDDVFRHMHAFITQVEEKSFYVEHARRALELVPDGNEFARQTARAILACYEYYAERKVARRDQAMADNLRFWRAYSGNKVVFWAASVHTARAPEVTVNWPPRRSAQWRSAAGHFAMGDKPERYVNINFTFARGTINAGQGPSTRGYPVPDPQPHFAEHRLAQIGHPQYLLDLRGIDASWADEPATFRVISPVYDPDNDGSYNATGGSPREWFDAFIHVREVTPSRLSAHPAGP